MVTSHSKLEVGIEACGCLTALGDETQTAEALNAGVIGLKPVPVLGSDGGDLVPIALCSDWRERIPPRWFASADSLRSRIPVAPWGDPGFPVFLSSSNFGVGNLLAYCRGGSEAHLAYATPGDCVESLCDSFGWGPDRTIVSHACVSSLVALELARRSIEHGGAEQAIVFSFDFVSPFVAGGFHALKILNPLFPAPYEDRKEGSIGLGDGAAFAVLSRKPQENLVSPAFLYNEMWHFTGNQPEGEGFRALEPWLRQTVGERKVWIKGHGTGTLEAGRLEAESLAELCPQAPLVSWKGSLGHTLGSCGLVELAVALAAVDRGVVPPTVGLSGSAFAPNVATDSFDAQPFDGLLLLANAFGGAHAAILVAHGD
ncbi:MAG: hypothetical protein DRP71_08675 [Verrucomicrobia bacterium]|nr:MAG: hypothetical protein DRP71_08675 [Verrucomicrobiota bacterium]